MVPLTSADQTETVLVSVLKDQRDLERLLTDHWYRIPVDFAPKRPFRFIAFYQPAAFKQHGRQIAYYARVASRTRQLRRELLPDEPRHPRANQIYVKYTFARIERLARPVRNIIPRRVTFGFTALAKLQTAEHLLELFDVAPIEQLVEAGLRRLDIPVINEYPIGFSSGRFRIDLAVRCRDGWLAIECDNQASHRTAAQKQKDAHKDTVLKHHGWRLVRLAESEVLNQFDRSLARVQLAIASLGGVAAGPAPR